MSTERIQSLLELMEAHDLGELELEEGDFKVRLAKRQSVITHAAPVAAAPQPAPASANAAESAASANAEEDTSGLKPIESPIVGTFYSAPSPDADPFVSVGQTVDKETVVCIIEAMKVMNEIKPEISGTIEKILVENGEAVEYGQPLFLVRP